MANSPVDKSKEFEKSGMTLITDPKSDYWLKKHAKNNYSTPPEDRMSRPCGGPNGFDDFVERWHE
jgi:hypothetical protein